MTFPDIDLSDSAKLKLRLFILASRAVLPEQTALIESEEFSELKIEAPYTWDPHIFPFCHSDTSSHFPWCRNSPATHRVYFSHLFEFIWKNFRAELNIPKIGVSLFYISEVDEEAKELKFLRYLMDEYKLRITGVTENMRRIQLNETLQSLRLSKEVAFLWFVMEAHRVNRLLNISGTDVCLEFMSEYVIAVAEGLNIPSASPTISGPALQTHVLYGCEHQRKFSKHFLLRLFIFCFQHAEQVRDERKQKLFEMRGTRIGAILKSAMFSDIMFADALQEMLNCVFGNLTDLLIEKAEAIQPD